nr:class I SAM-dependent methyltransferase [Ramlibacter alkalitolerans]
MRERWPARELESPGRCPVCGTERRTLVHPGLEDGLFHCSEDRWDVHACTACGTHYLDPRPTEESIGRAYASYLTHAAPDDPRGRSPAASARGRAARVLRALANGYRNARFGTRLEPQLPVGRYVVPCIPLLRDALVQQLRSLPLLPAGAQARLLDVGCGSGDFLQLARSAGWSVHGIDFDGVAVANARERGLEVRQGGLELLQATEAESFAWVTLSHVLEHVHDPVSWLQALHRLVRPGGTLWLQTPNIASLGHARYGAHWRGLEPPRHLTLWTLPTLRKALEQAGFRSVQALRTPVLTAMEVYASSEALRRGIDYAGFMALPRKQQRPLGALWPALRQHRSLARAEFLTVLARR